MAKPQDASQTIAQELEHLARTKADAAWRLACAMLGNEADAEDALQQAFVIALSKAAEAPRPLPWPWFAMLLTNVCRNLRRRRKIRSAEPFEERLMSHELPNAPSDPAQAALLREDAQRAKKILARLNDDQREALSLTTLAGLTHAEAAEARGININTQKTQARRGMEALREEMGGSEARVVTALTAMPFMAPLGDLAENLVSLVQSTAETLVTPIGSGLTSTIAATTATTTKVILMSKSLVATIAAVAGIAIGAAATVIALPSVEAKPTNASHAQHATQEDAALLAAKDLEISNVRRTLKERDAAIYGLRDDFAARESKWREELVALNEANAAAKAELDAALTAEAANSAPLEFAHTKGMVWLRSEQFKVFTKEYQTYSKQYTATLIAEATGGEITSEDNTKMQRTYEELERRYGAPIMLMMATLPSHSYDRFQATMNHPGLVSGLWTNWLEDAELPLSSSQENKIKELAQAFDKGWEDAQKKYEESTLNFTKVADEWRLKQDFQEGYLAVLSVEQRAQIVDPALHGHIVFRRFSPIEVLNEYLVFSYDEPRLLEQLKSVIQERLAAPEGFTLLAEEPIKQFLLDAQPYYGKPGHLNERSRAQIEKMIELETQLLEEFRTMTEDAEFLERIRKFDRLFAPALMR